VPEPNQSAAVPEPDPIAGSYRFTPSHRGGEGEPLLLLHGFTANWRTWEPVLPALEARHDVLAPTLAGHAGGPMFPAAGASDGAIADAVEAAMDAAGWESAHIVGNSLGGYIAFLLAARGRARSVVALAPAGGWALGDDAFPATLRYFRTLQKLVREAAPHADAIVSTPEGRSRATADYAATYEHMSDDLIKSLMLGAAACEGAEALLEFAEREGWNIDAERVTCPVRFVWGTEDRILPLPGAAVRYREEWFPTADWVELEGGGHSPQLDRPRETAELILGVTG
jgi:pimeloyl-ACP methyl ester carboxylesterase